MRVLMACHYYYPYRSGVTEYMRLLAQGLVHRGHEVTVLASRSSPEYPAYEVSDKIKIIRLPVLMNIDRACIMPTFLPKIYSLSKQFDIVNIHLPFPELFPVAFALRNRKLVCTYHCDINLKGGYGAKLLESLYYWSVRSGLKYASAVVFNSKEYFDGSRVKDSSYRAEFIYPPLKPMERRDPTALRKRLALEDGPVVGFAGRLVHEKGIDYLIKAFGTVKQSIPNAKLVIAGDDKVAGGSIKQGLVKLAEKYSGDVMFPGFFDGDVLKEFYSLCDVFVLPSIETFESFGMVQVEAMVCGTPVIATTLPGVTVPVSETGMGLLVPPRDTDALALAIIQALTHKEKYTINKEKIVEKFGLKKAVDDYERLFSDIAQNK